MPRELACVLALVVTGALMMLVRRKRGRRQREQMRADLARAAERDRRAAQERADRIARERAEADAERNRRNGK